MDLVYAVIERDRRFGIHVVVCASREAADAEIADFKTRYDDHDTWEERSHGAPLWLRYVECISKEDVVAYIQLCEVKR